MRKRVEIVEEGLHEFVGLGGRQKAGRHKDVLSQLCFSKVDRTRVKRSFIGDASDVKCNKIRV